jgi:TnpA family transposase
LRDVPPELDDFELTTFFSYSADERRIIDARRQPLHRLAVALHIGFIRMTGRPLDVFERIPKRLWAHIGEQIGVPAPEVASIRSLYVTRAQTLYDHQQVACVALGFRQMTEHQRRYVVRWLRETLAGRAGGILLLPDLKRWFYDHRILLVAERELRRLIAGAQRDHEAQLIDGLVRAYGAPRLAEWDQTLASTRDDGTPLQTWLWSAPRKQSTVQMSEVFDKIEYLRGMGVHADWPELANDAAVRYYGRRCANRPPSVGKRISSTRRPLEVGCFLRYALCTTSDQLLLMLRRWIRKMASQATTETAPKYADVQKRLREFALAVRGLATNQKLTYKQLRAQLCTMADDTLQQANVSRAALARSWLIGHTRQARTVLTKLLTLPLAAEGDHPVIKALGILRELYAGKATELPPVAGIDLGRRWRDAITGDDREKAMHAFEWATLFKLRVSLRNGSVHLAHSFAFRGHASLLIPKEQWQAQRNSHYGHLKLPQDPKEFLGPIKEKFEERVEQFADAVGSGKILVDADGMHLEQQPASPEELRVAELRRALYADREPGQIADMMLDLDSHVRFSWLLLGREPYNRSELLLTYAGVLALSTSMTAAEVARMVPGLGPEAVRQMTKRLCDDRKLRMASDAVLQYLHRFDIAANWGRGDLASSDMMSLQTPRAVWQARADPRRKTASIGIYTHAMDRWGFFYDQPIVLNQWQAGAAIEGVVRQSAVEDIGQLAVDTHGYTHFGMALAKYLHLDLCPRLAHLNSRRLHAMVGFATPKALLPVLDCDIVEAAIEATYDEHVRIAASVRSGQCSAVQALHRYGSDARGQQVYDGGVQFGMLLCSIFLMDYFLLPPFRGEIQHVLNRGEGMHTLQRSIHDGAIPNDLAKHSETLAGVSSALSLMSNIVMAWNARHMQAALDRIQAAGGAPSPADLRRIAPTNIEGVNLRGTFDFPVEKYAERILPSSVVGSSSARSRTA